MRVLAIIPARGGSKGIHKKNLLYLHGRSLVAWATKSANEATKISKTIISTDDVSISIEAINLGASFLGPRPPDLSSDVALDQPVLRYELLAAEKFFQMNFDLVVMLQPTSPLRTSSDIDFCISELIKHDATSVWTISHIEKHFHYKKQLIKNEDGFLELAFNGSEVIRRQELSDSFRRNGAVYVYTRKTVLNDPTLRGNRCLGIVLTHETSNIDKMNDLEIARRSTQVVNGDLKIIHREFI
jgi:CMP-N-acetylneuraminic acid synthetase